MDTINDTITAVSGLDFNLSRLRSTFLRARPILKLLARLFSELYSTQSYYHYSLLPYVGSISIFTTTAEIHACSLVNFYCQYADRHMNLKFMRPVSERERAIRQFVIVKNKLMSVFNVSVLLLTMNFVITLSK